MTPRRVAPASLLASLGLLALAAASLGPLLLEPRPVRPAALPPALPVLWLKLVVVALLAVPVVLWIRAQRRTERHPVLLGLGLVLAGGLMTALHWWIVDRRVAVVPLTPGGRPQELFYARAWQQYLYAAVFNHWTEPFLASVLPHIYRPLPYGFTRSLERLTGDWAFACAAYRWFFDFWLAAACYRFVRLFHDPAKAGIAVGILLALYPFSIMYYWGQLTDPISHALFVLALLWIVEDWWPGVVAAVLLGMLAKETAAVLVPAYWVCHRGEGRAVTWKAAALGAGCAAAFVGTRWPLGWRGASPLHSFSGLMIKANLVGDPAVITDVPVYQNYLQVILFVGIFVPAIARRWRVIDPRLKALGLTLVPLILLGGLCFSWLYESRNYVPLLPLLAAMALGPPAGRVAPRQDAG
ncbi:MAG: hypothetical protein HY294_02935 [Candidatus Rokubacteria bacterium]|nr:hypothetical protein [Candidatus Rokubacteria bacterium]MBI3824931.1 hypothetical protein [Candidatus Rokubacteria bacterium]